MRVRLRVVFFCFRTTNFIEITPVSFPLLCSFPDSLTTSQACCAATRLSSPCLSMTMLIIFSASASTIQLHLTNADCLCVDNATLLNLAVASGHHFSILSLSLAPHHLTDYLTYHLICAPDLVPHDWGACDCSHNPMTNHLISTIDFPRDQACDLSHDIM